MIAGYDGCGVGRGRPFEYYRGANKPRANLGRGAVSGYEDAMRGSEKR